MASRREFETAMRNAEDAAARIESFGALLAKASGLGPELCIVGGSAITIYTDNRYVSGDIDVVGRREKIVPVLQEWGFQPEPDSDGRVYWSRSDPEICVDIIHRVAGSGRSGRPRTVSTRFGPVRIASVDDLIVRRLVFWSREGTPELMDQAVDLYVTNGSRVDTEYLEAEVRYEGVEVAYEEMRRLSRVVAHHRR